MATELHEVEAATQEFDQQLVARAQNLRQALVGQLSNELQANWTLAPGTLFTAKALSKWRAHLPPEFIRWTRTA